jgi:hypothetical protein
VRDNKKMVNSPNKENIKQENKDQAKKETNGDRYATAEREEDQERERFK